MQERYPDDVVTISWNLDHADSDKPLSDELRNSVVEQLRALAITSRNVISADPLDKVVTELGVFGLPATLVYGRDGKLAKQFEGVFSYDGDVTPLVAELLGG